MLGWVSLCLAAGDVVLRARVGLRVDGGVDMAALVGEWVR